MARRTPEGPPPPPPVQKLRIRYARRGRLRFSSARDFGRALERALRRAGVPMAFSAGFHPHPKISYAGAAPTGAASEAEYFEISVTERVDPDAVRVALDDALPDDLVIMEVVEAGPGSLADRLEASSWQICLPHVSLARASAAAQCLLDAERAEVTRTFKTGPKTFDVRCAVLSVLVEDGSSQQSGSPGDAPPAAASPPESYAILHVVVRHTTPSVRPDDILTALRAVGELEPPVPPMVTRLAQGPLLSENAGVADPLAADKDAIGP